jgi:HEAT repeat protein
MWEDWIDPDEITSERLDELASLNHPALQEILVEVISHPSSRIRVAAGLKLAELFQDVRAVPVLAEALENGDRLIRDTAAEALWDIGDVNTSGLLAILRREPITRRQMIVDALERVGWRPDALDDEVAYLITIQAWKGCIALGKDAVSGLVSALNSPDGTVRRGAAWALGEMGDERAVEALIGRLADTEGGMFGDGRVCDVAAESLLRIGTPEALNAVKVWQKSSQTKAEV